MDPQKIIALAAVAGRLALGLSRFVELSEALQVDAVELGQIAASLSDALLRGGPRTRLDS